MSGTEDVYGEVVRLRDENRRLRAFAAYVLDNSFEGLDTDGGSAQDMAEKLGLIELRPCAPEDSIDGEAEHYFFAWETEDKS